MPRRLVLISSHNSHERQVEGEKVVMGMLKEARINRTGLGFVKREEDDQNLK
jgi:hypothetical protein